MTFEEAEGKPSFLFYFLSSLCVVFEYWLYFDSALCAGQLQFASFVVDHFAIVDRSITVAMAYQAQPAPVVPLPEFEGVELDRDMFVELLRKLISVSEQVQNNPAQGLVPKESLVVKFLLEVLEPHTTDNGGPLKVKVLEYVEGRANLKITYQGSTDKTLSLIHI